MKKIICILVCSLLFSSYCYSQEDYPIPNESAKELILFKLEIQKSLKDITDSIGVLKKKQLKDALDIAGEMGRILSQLRMLDYTLHIERLHGEAQQYNHSAIKIIMSYISGETSSDLAEVFPLIYTAQLANEKDPLIFKHRDNLKDYFARMQGLFIKVDKELSQTLNNSEYFPHSE